MAAIVGLMDRVMSTYLKMDGWLVAIALMIGVRGFACALLDGSTVRVTDKIFLAISGAKIGIIPALFLVFFGHSHNCRFCIKVYGIWTQYVCSGRKCRSG